ncbi:MAG: hypothetical protein MI975_20470 [Cytophagales bacterium]|nr:hypothetical protein [Cytophagales bacterium]
MKAKKISLSNKIDNHLVLNASFIDNLGLMHGKMGLSIYFFRIGQRLNNKIYSGYAEELIDEIYNEIDESVSADFENGLAGIGWGVEYLIQNGFVKADADEVLEDFDRLLIKEILHLGLLNGLIGFGAYLLKRIQSTRPDGENIVARTNQQFLIYVLEELDKRTQDIARVVKEPKISCHREENKEGANFDITWDYPILIWFLTDLLTQNLFNAKIENFILRSLEPLKEKNNLPKSVGNRLMLAFSVINLFDTVENYHNGEVVHGTEFKGKLDEFKLVSEDLLKRINRENVLSEFSANKGSVRNGIPGIVWIYNQFYKITSNFQYKDEAKYWSRSGLFFKDVENIISGCDLGRGKEQDMFGLLDGLAGIRLISASFMTER